jgi:hypothetical protein
MEMDGENRNAPTADGYVVSRMTGRLAVTALGNPPRDLGSFPLPQSAAAVILADAAGSESARHGARFALEFLAALENPSASPCVTIRRTRLESWLSALANPAREVGPALPSPNNA